MNLTIKSAALWPVFAALFALCMVALPAPAWTAPVEIDRIVAIVDNDVISHTELMEQIRTVRAQLRQQRISPPSERILQRQVLERMVLEQIQLQLASEVGILVDDDNLNQAISGIAAQNNLSLSEFRSVLQEEGFDFAQFRENIRKEMILHRLRQQHVDNRISVTDQEVDNFLATQRRQGQGSDEYHLGHILIAAPDAASPEQIQETRERSQAIYTQLKEGADFSQTAIASSDGQHALSGGDLGWRKAGELPTLFAEIVPQMRVGEISEPIRSGSGFHIVKLLGHRAGETRVLTQTRARHILVETGELLGDDAARELLRDLKGRIAAGASFAELAHAHSDDVASASTGGDLGWVNPGEMVPAFEQAMDGLAIGEISEPVQTPFGWHLVEVIARRERDVTEEFSREMARESIFRRKAEEEFTDWLRRLREDAYVEYRL
jgi:peptidyl-prolyl cis-trans isomerase SurA